MAIKILGSRSFGEDRPDDPITVPDPDRIELSYLRPPLNEIKSDAVGKNTIRRVIGLQIGDEEKGPRVRLWCYPPATPEEIAKGPSLGGAHSHVCDNFRIVMRGQMQVGHDRYEPGDFRLQRAGRPYGGDGGVPHPDGHWAVLCFADRRGYRGRSVNPERRALFENDEVIRRESEVSGINMLPADHPGVNGLVTTLTDPWSKGHNLDGKVGDADGWPQIGNGARVCVNLMGDHEVGPVVFLQRTEPGQMATPAGTFGSDVFRCVMSGSCHGDGVVLAAGEVRAYAAGERWPSATAGDDGLTELIIIGDRRGLDLAVEGKDNGWGEQARRIVDELSTVLPRLDALTA